MPGPRTWASAGRRMRGSGSASSAILLLIALDLVEAQVARGRTVLLPAILYGGPVERRSVASRGCHPSRTWAFDASILHGRRRAAASRLPCARLPYPSGGRASPRYSQPAACWPLMARSSSLRRRRRRRRTGVRPTGEGRRANPVRAARGELRRDCAGPTACRRRTRARSRERCGPRPSRRR
jgi:hypothetical protein